MENHILEVSYPITFRENDAKVLGENLKNRHCVVLIGMKRVGIANFLRFFLNHKDIKQTYIADEKQHLFIPVDLIDLVEREMFPFWSLTLKRIVDASEKSTLSQKVKKEIATLFLESIQSQDLFFTIDSIRKALVAIVEAGVMPTVFFIRFDRIKDAVTPAFFDNLHGLSDATHQKLTYVFTSFKSLDKLAPLVFTKAVLSVFVRNVFFLPAGADDTKIIYDTYKRRYTLSLSEEIEKTLFDIVDGYVQYLQLSLILLNEQKGNIKTKEELYSFLAKDEQMTLQSEELWESVEEDEKAVLQQIASGKKTSSDEKEKAKYLWDTGVVVAGTDKIFSPLFAEYVTKRNGEEKEKEYADFTKKEHLLFSFLEQNKDEICEREKIIEAVWPEVTTLGVTDWAVDRLVARVRNKLKLKGSLVRIETIKTRGYKLVSS